MNELLLSTTERKTKTVYTKKDYLGNPIQTRTVWNEYPIGQVISVKTEIDTRREWLNIVCNMAAPAFIYTHPSGAIIQRKDKTAEGLKQWIGLGFDEKNWQAILDCWTYNRFDMWFKGSIKEPVTRVIDEISTWTDVEKSLQKDDIGLDPYGLQYICDVYPWNPATKRRSFVVVNEDEDVSMVKTYQTILEDDQEVNPDEFEVVMKPAKVIDWVNGLELSTESKEEVANTEFIKNPRYDKLVEKSKALEPVVIKSVIAVSK